MKLASLLMVVLIGTTQMAHAQFPPPMEMIATSTAGEMQMELERYDSFGVFKCYQSRTGSCEIAYGTRAQSAPTYFTLKIGGNRGVSRLGDDIVYCISSKRDVKWPSCLKGNDSDFAAIKKPLDGSTGLLKSDSLEREIGLAAQRLLGFGTKYLDKDDGFHLPLIVELDELLARLNQLDQRYPDGQWKLVGIENYWSALIKTDFQRSEATLRRWKALQPQSVAVAVLEGVFWQSYAWNARGEGFASSVTPEGWALYRERMDKALNAMEGSRSYAAGNWLWNEKFINLASNVDWDPKNYSDLLKSAVDRNPAYANFYRRALLRQTPRWGGSYDSLDKFINGAVANTRQFEGEGMYARLYAELPTHMDDPGQIFTESKANWPRMNKAFEDLIQRFPRGASIANKHALFACFANDRVTYAKARSRLGDAVLSAAWPRAYSVDVCDRRMLTQS